MYRFLLPAALFLWGLYLLYEGMFSAKEPGFENEWKWGLGFMVIAIFIGALRYAKMSKPGFK